MNFFYKNDIQYIKNWNIKLFQWSIFNLESLKSDSLTRTIYKPSWSQKYKNDRNSLSDHRYVQSHPSNW